MRGWIVPLRYRGWLRDVGTMGTVTSSASAGGVKLEGAGNQYSPTQLLGARWTPAASPPGAWDGAGAEACGEGKVLSHGNASPALGQGRGEIGTGAACASPEWDRAELGDFLVFLCLKHWE